MKTASRFLFAAAATAWSWCAGLPAPGNADLADGTVLDFGMLSPQSGAVPVQLEGVF